MGQASTNIKAMLRERLAGAEAEAALLKTLIDFVDEPVMPTPKIDPRRKGKYLKCCTKCKKIQWVAGNRRHCPLCHARNSLKIQDG